MNDKLCKKCNTLKNINDFNKDKTRKDGHFSWCKKCASLYKKKNQKHYNFVSVDKQVCCTCGEEKNASEFHNNNNNKNGISRICKNCKSINDKKFNNENKEKILKRNKDYFLKNKEEIKKKIKEKRKNDALFLEKERDRSRKYREQNREALLKKKIEYYKKNINEINRKNLKRRHEDLSFRIVNNLRSRISHAMKNNSKGLKTADLLGCSVEEFREYIQSLFKEGMSWDNYGIIGWHIDHIIPCDSFDMSDIEQQKKCFHYKNMQPLWAKENRLKWNKTQEE